jgi:hypothetical protein
MKRAKNKGFCEIQNNRKKHSETISKDYPEVRNPKNLSEMAIRRESPVRKAEDLRSNLWWFSCRSGFYLFRAQVQGRIIP